MTEARPDSFHKERLALDNKKLNSSSDFEGGSGGNGVGINAL